MQDHMAGLTAFVQAAELGSFVMAGRQLGISSSAVGKSVARLEQRLGVRLFHRSTRSMTLTTEGTLFLDRCHRIFGEIEAAELELAQLSSAPRGKLRVSLPMIGMLLMPTLTEFMQAYPDIEVDLDFTDRMVDLIEEGVDVAIRTGEVSDSRLKTRTLGPFIQQLWASPAYLAHRGTPRVATDLRLHSCLHHKFPSTGKIERWPLSGADAEIELPSAGVASTTEPLIYMVERAMGIAYLPDFAVRRQAAAGTVVCVLGDHVLHQSAIRLLWPSSRHLAPKIRAFVDFMSEHLFPASLSSPAPAASPAKHP